MVKKRGVGVPGLKTFEGPAQLWRRVLAFVFDLFVIDVVFVSSFKGFFEGVVPSGFSASMNFFESNAGLVQSLTVVVALIALLVLLYFSVLQFRVGQTLGQYFVGVYVKSEGKVLSFWQCVLSNITFIPFFPFFILWVVDPLHMFFSGKSQRLMQRFAKVVVVQRYVV